MANNFYSYFRQNMESMNLPAPENLFGTLGLAVASAKTILSEIDKFGPTVTVAELIVAGTKLEILGVIGACSAMFYAGAVIGSNEPFRHMEEVAFTYKKIQWTWEADGIEAEDSWAVPK